VRAASSDDSGVVGDRRVAPRRCLLLGVGVVALCLALLAALVVAPRVSPFGEGHRVVLSRSGVVGGPTPAGADVRAAVESLLDARSRAVLAADPAAFRATQTADAAGPDITRLDAVPWSRWSYSVEQVTTGAPDPQASVEVATRLAGEPGDDTVPETITLHEESGRWLVRSEVSRSAAAPLWSLGRLSAVTGRAVLVIGIDEPREVLDAYAASVDREIAQVSKVWGDDWARRAVIIVPSSVAQLARGLARSTGSLAGLAALTASEAGGAAGAGTRIWTNTAAMATLSTLGREIVVRHELTHVATGAPGSASTPLWLEEGFAEYVGYLGSGVRPAVELQDLLRATRAGRAPRHLPAAAAFSQGDIAVSYEAAALACTMIAEQFGAAALVRVYRLTSHGDADPEANAESAVAQVTGTSFDAFEASWRARTVALAG
jgi:hypothetical protein